MATDALRSAFAAALADAGGAAAPRSATAGLRRALSGALGEGVSELERSRSGYPRPVPVAVASADGHLLAGAPVAAAFRADPAASPPRALLLVGALVAALVDLAGAGARPPARIADLRLRAGEHDGFLVLALPAAPVAPGDLEDLLPLAFDERARQIDRLRAQALAVPAALLDGAIPTLREPIGDGHPLRVAEAVARLGGEPADPGSVDEHEDAVLGLLALRDTGTRPHEDPDPARRTARRILQRLNGMGKWGGYHTDVAHLARGFAGNERALAQEVGEALLASGMLAEKRSVGQRHVFLNPRRAADVHRFIETGDPPAGLRLPSG